MGSLFTNFPIKDAVEAALRKLENDPALADRTTLTPVQITDLLDFVLRSRTKQKRKHRSDLLRLFLVTPGSPRQIFAITTSRDVTLTWEHPEFDGGITSLFIIIWS